MTILENWIRGEARMSKNTFEVFGTKKERRMFDRQYLKPRLKVRPHKKARRAKAVRD